MSAETFWLQFITFEEEAKFTDKLVMINFQFRNMQPSHAIDYEWRINCPCRTGISNFCFFVRNVLRVALLVIMNFMICSDYWKRGLLWLFSMVSMVMIISYARRIKLLTLQNHFSRHSAHFSSFPAFTMSANSRHNPNAKESVSEKVT